MPRTKSLINNFTSGEQLPKLRARTNLKAFQNGCEEMTNMVSQRHGGAVRRGGSHFIDRVKDESTVHQMIDFIFSEDQAYGIIAGNLYFWFILNNALLTEATTAITGAADNGAGLIQVTATSHGLLDGEYVSISGMLGTTEGNGVWVVANKTANTIDLTGSAFVNTWVSGGTVGKIVEVTTPYTTADLPDLDWSQDGDVLHLTGANYAPRTLTRTSATAFSLAVKQFNFPPVTDANTSATTLTLSGGVYTIGSVITVTASAAVFTDTELTGHINSCWQSHDGSWLITAFTSTTVVTATVTNDCATSAASATWSEAEWSGVRGWPHKNTFYEQRWITGPTITKKQTFWGSALNGPLDFFSTTTDDDDPYEHKVRANRINTITWLSPQSTLLIGTLGSEFKASGNNNGLLTASSPVIRSQTSFGSTGIRPVQVGNATIYVHQSKRRLYDIIFDFQVDAFDGDQLTLLAEHIFPVGTTITRIAFQQDPDNIVWIVTNTGKLISMTYLPKQEILAFAQHTIGGTATVVEDVMVLPNSTIGDDQVYIMVKRTINGATHRYIEYLDSDLFVDSGLTGTHSPAATTLSNINHLVGETVDIVGDLSPYSQKVVSATGTVTKDTAENTITTSQVGLPMPTPTLIPNEIDPLVLQGASTLGRPKRLSRLYVRTLDTPGLKINGVRTAVRSSQDDMDAIPPINTIDDWDMTELGYDDNAKITLTQDQPIAFNVLGIFGEWGTGE